MIRKLISIASLQVSRILTKERSPHLSPKLSFSGLASCTGPLVRVGKTSQHSFCQRPWLVGSLYSLRLPFAEAWRLAASFARHQLICWDDGGVASCAVYLSTLSRTV